MLSTAGLVRKTPLGNGGIYSLQTSPGAAAAQSATYSFNTTYAELYFMCGFMQVSSGTPIKIFRWTTSSGAEQGSLRWESSNKLGVYVGTTLKGTTDVAFSISRFYRMEVRVKINASTGIIDVRVDDVTQTASSVSPLWSGDTTSGSGNIGGWGINVPLSSGGKAYWDDVCINDTTGSFNNSWAGENYIQRLDFTAAGTNNALTTDSGAGASDNYTHINNKTSTGATPGTPNISTATYVYTAAVGDKDTYLASALPGEIGSINAVMAVAYCVKGSSNAPTKVDLECISGATTSDGSDLTMPTSWGYVNRVFETDPNTGAAWTKTNLGTAEFGFKSAT